MNNYDSASSGLGFFGFLLGVFLIPFLIIALVTLIGMWKIHTKAGKPGWAVLIPIYNLVVYLQIIGKPLYWILLMCIPVVNIVFIIWSLNLLSKSFGKGEGFTVGLLFFPFIFYPILGFGGDKYLGPGGAATTPNFAR